MVFFNIDEGTLDGGRQQQEQRTIGNRPQTVSSLSSISDASLPPLPSMEALGSSSTVVSSTTTVAASSADANFGLSTRTNNNTFMLVTAPAATQKQESAVPSAMNLVGSGALQLSPSTGVLVTATPNTNTVPEFLYQLTKMLTDNNRDIIEWSNGKIEVHSPQKLEIHVLNRYFRHSKFASFQRQLNYFGFRKLAGKGKMAPCSYVNDATTDELGSLLLIKRKQGNELKSKSGGKKRARGGKEGKSESPATNKTSGDPVNPVLAGILYRSTSSDNALPATSNTNNNTLKQSQKAIARVAVGKGVRHGYVPQQFKNRLKSNDSSSNSLYTQQVAATTTVTSSPVEVNLDALTQNFNQSMHETISSIDDVKGNPPAIQSHQDTNQYPLPLPAHVSTNTTERVPYVPGSLHRDDSLVDLAMIPIIGDGITAESNAASSSGFSFVDFPFDSDIFSNEDPNI